jgi:hypothetical protein
LLEDSLATKVDSPLIRRVTEALYRAAAPKHPPRKRLIVVPAARSDAGQATFPILTRAAVKSANFAQLFRAKPKLAEEFTD